MIAYPAYTVQGVADTVTFDILVANSSSNSVEDRELRFKVEGSKGVKDVVVHLGAIRSGEQARVKVSAPAKDVCDGECRIYASVVSGPGIQDRVVGDVSVSAKPQAKLSIADLWVEANQADGARSFRFSVFNRSAWSLSRAKVTLDVRSGIGDGYSLSPSNVVFEQDLTDFTPGTKRSFSIALPDSLALESRLGAQIAIASQRRIVGRKRRDFQDLGSDKLEVFYSQRSHQRQAQEAINLLAKQGIKLPDLGNMSYLGVPIEEGWPATARPPIQDVYATGSTYTMFASASDDVTTDMTLMSGLNDVDGVDVIFGYTGPLVGGDRFDSHFWIVDDFDDDGLGDHHSALTKVRALLFGRAGASDSRWKYGAIDHYKHGHKHAAYWLLGQAAHLLGDMSVPEHVDDENWHGVWGSAYENWMAKNSYRWTADHAWVKGGIINPYRTNGRLVGPHPELGNPLRNDDPVRFLMYTTAQVANAFPWYSLGWKGGYDNAQNGNVDFGVNPGNHFEDYLNTVLASLPPKPRAKADLKDNSTNDGNYDDGDLSVIASNSYVNGIRAVAGLLYYFGIETGQIPKLKSNPAMGAIQQLLLD